MVTDDRILAEPDIRAKAAGVLEAGGSRVALHVRGPRTPGRLVYDLAGALIEFAARTGAWLVVNDRVDVAVALGIRRAHLGVRSIPARDARRILAMRYTPAPDESGTTGGDVTIGLSVYEPGDVMAARREGIDYYFTGPVFQTPSHPGAAGGGTTLVRDVAAASRVPALAIGGLTPELVGAARDNGAWGVAVIRAVWDATSPGAAVERFLEEL